MEEIMKSTGFNCEVKLYGMLCGWTWFVQIYEFPGSAEPFIHSKELFSCTLFR